jgi:hypothetical protein
MLNRYTEGGCFEPCAQPSPWPYTHTNTNRGREGASIRARNANPDPRLRVGTYSWQAPGRPRPHRPHTALHRRRRLSWRRHRLLVNSGGSHLLEGARLPLSSTLLPLYSHFPPTATAFRAHQCGTDRRSLHACACCRSEATIGSDATAAKSYPPSLVLAPPPGTAIFWRGHLTHAGLPVTAGVRHVFVASFDLRVPRSK